MPNNIFQKLAVAAFGSALSCAVLMQANQAKATTFSFLQGGYSVSFSGPTGNTVPPSAPFLPNFQSNNNVISGSFTGNDLNGDGVISGSEVTDFTLDFFGLTVKYGFPTYNLLTKDLSLTASLYPSFPPPQSFITLNLTASPVGGQFYEDLYGYGFSIHGYSGDVHGVSNQRVEVTVTSVPEPKESALTALAVLGVGFLLKKKVSSSKEQ